MAVEILEHRIGTNNSCLKCTTSGAEFGPSFNRGEDVESFLGYIAPKDARELTERDLETKVEEWRNIKNETV